MALDPEEFVTLTDHGSMKLRAAAVRAMTLLPKERKRTTIVREGEPAILAVREFEAESVSYLDCSRLGIDTASDEYLAAYVRRSPATPPISLDRVMKAVWLLEQMGRASFGLRKAQPPPTA
jgi:hypothetical protein